LTALLAFFIALRVLIPPGFMLSPEALAEGHLQVTLCDGYGTRQVTVDRDGNIVDPAHDEQGSRDRTCDFALASVVAHLPPAQGLIAVAQAEVAASLPIAGLEFVHSPTQGPPLGSRAPPAPQA